MKRPDLFGDPEPPARVYVPPYPIVVNTLRNTLEKMARADRWPWERTMRESQMTRHIPKLLALLPPDEAEDWRRRIEAEAVRLAELEEAEAA